MTSIYSCEPSARTFLLPDWGFAECGVYDPDSENPCTSDVVVTTVALVLCCKNVQINLQKVQIKHHREFEKMPGNRIPGIYRRN